MKKFLNFYTAALFALLAVLVACGGGSEPDLPTPEELQIALMTRGQATIATDGVKLGGTAPVTPSGESWDNFALTVTANAAGTGGTITALNVPDSYGDVWPDSSPWSFHSSTDPTQILRESDNVVMTFREASPTSVTVSFTIESSGGRVVEGDWTFLFTIPEATTN